jgi:hypothetical protein
MHLTTITFPDLHLSQRDGHKLRGYFSEQFGQQSDLWHNHSTDGKPIYRYPLIQYKVVDNVPRVLGLEKGAELLINHFLDVQEIKIDDLVIPVHSKQVHSQTVEIGVRPQLFTYRFSTPWFALNQEKHQEYQQAPKDERLRILNGNLISNMFSLMKAVGYREKERIMTQVMDLKSVPGKFKGQTMNMFKGKFVTNVELPSYIGLGKSVSRGYGTIISETN